jgi:hypothetical protein
MDSLAEVVSGCSLNPAFLKQHIVYIVVLAIMLGPGCYLPFKKKLGRTVLDT